uniref:Uncharacterized protein n=1 Tax=Oryza brachyantha TaxID=4533 RepID=J3MYN1_ORYBR
SSSSTRTQFAYHHVLFITNSCLTSYIDHEKTIRSNQRRVKNRSKRDGDHHTCEREKDDRPSRAEGCGRDHVEEEKRSYRTHC